MKLQFKVRSKTSIIYYRITNGRNGLSTTKTTPLKLKSSDVWSDKKQLTHNNLELNKTLLELHNHFTQLHNDALSNGLRIDKVWLQITHHKFFYPKSDIKPTPTLLNFVNDYMNNVCKSEPLKAKIRTLILHLNIFDTTTLLKDINTKWNGKFQQYLLTNNYAESTINKMIHLLKQLVRFAQDEELEIRPNFLTSKSLKSSTITHYLNEDEVSRLFTFRPSKKALNNARMLFLIGCTTGLRVSDLMRIKQFDIKDGMMELTTTKTRQNIIIPIDNRVKNYISKVYTIAHPVFNRHIKNLFDEFGLTEITEGYIKGKGNKRAHGFYPKNMLMTSHCMRRSFATNLYGKIPTMVIMAITGHTTEKSFLTYIKKPQKDFANELRQFYHQRISN